MKKDGEFGSLEVAAVVGIQPTLVSKFIERKQYGIKASVHRGKRGKDRVFSEEDIHGIALVYWLIECGLRSDSIQFILNQVGRGGLETRANDAAAAVRGQQAELLVVTREPRTGYAKHPKQDTRLCDAREAERILREASTSSVLVVPVANHFRSLRTRLERI